MASSCETALPPKEPTKKFAPAREGVIAGQIAPPPLLHQRPTLTTDSARGRFHIPLIEPDMQISRIRLSDERSRLRPRPAVRQVGQTHEPEVLV